MSKSTRTGGNRFAIKIKKWISLRNFQSHVHSGVFSCYAQLKLHETKVTYLTITALTLNRVSATQWGVIENF